MKYRLLFIECLAKARNVHARPGTATRASLAAMILGVSACLTLPNTAAQDSEAATNNKSRWTPPSPDLRNFEGVWLPGGYDNAPKKENAGGAAAGSPGTTSESPPAAAPLGNERPVSLDTAANLASGSTLECTPVQRLAGAGGGMANLWIQGPNEIVMISEEDMDIRKIYLNAQHPKNVKPQPNGHSIGHWEGNTLVVDSIGFSNANGTDIGEHVIERFTRNGNWLIDEATITTADGKTQHQTMRSSWRSDLHVFENVCEENFDRFEFHDGQLIHRTP